MAKLIKKIYGDALFETAVKIGKTDMLMEESQALLKILGENKDYLKLLGHPEIRMEEKQNMLEAAFERCLSQELLGLLKIAVSKGRTKDIPDILEYFILKVKEYKKIGLVLVISAGPLSGEQKERVQNKLLKVTDFEKLEIVYKLDESLIGGIVIRVGDWVADGSVKNRLNQLKAELQKIQLS